MRSWLASPTVAFLSFSAAVITIVEAVFIAAKWAKTLMHTTKPTSPDVHIHVPVPFVSPERRALYQARLEEAAAREGLHLG
jgi:hypothetical protein